MPISPPPCTATRWRTFWTLPGRRRRAGPSNTSCPDRRPHQIQTGGMHAPRGVSPDALRHGRAADRRLALHGPGLRHQDPLDPELQGRPRAHARARRPRSWHSLCVWYTGPALGADRHPRAPLPLCGVRGVPHRGGGGHRPHPDHALLARGRGLARRGLDPASRLRPGSPDRRLSAAAADGESGHASHLGARRLLLAGHAGGLAGSRGPGRSPAERAGALGLLRSHRLLPGLRPLLEDLALHLLAVHSLLHGQALRAPRRLSAQGRAPPRIGRRRDMLSTEISPKAQAVVEAFKKKLTRQAVLSLATCVNCGMCNESCHYYVATGDPKMTPAYKAGKVRKLFKYHVDWLGRVAPGWVGAKTLQTDDDLADLKDVVYGSCSMCRRCTVACPFGGDTAPIMRLARGLLTARGLG